MEASKKEKETEAVTKVSTDTEPLTLKVTEAKTATKAVQLSMSYRSEGTDPRKPRAAPLQ